MPSFPRAVPERPLRLSLPRPPEEPPKHPFPWFATVAPVAGSVALWALTQSIYALAFAALGPLIAIASVGDARLNGRRTRRREHARFEREIVRAHDSVTVAHARERADLAAIAPGARSLIDSRAPDPERWRGSFDRPIVVRLGLGSVPSVVAIDGEADATERAASELESVRTAAATIRAAPVIVDARLGIGLYGPRPLVLAAARAIVVQLSAALSPATTAITGAAWSWLNELPHQTASPVASALASERIVMRDGDRQAVVAMAHTHAELPRDTRVMVSVAAGGAAITHHPDPLVCGPVQLEFLSEAEAAAWARRQAEYARAEGIGVRQVGPPDLVELSDIVQTSPLAPSAIPQPGLRSALGISGDGPVFLDLVHDGPHAIVGGTTGSGKSELLISWVIAMAAWRPPAQVSFLFVDFKGGAAFEPLRALPHSVGLITDLDAYQAGRALSSLKAEGRRRERVLASVGARSIDDERASPLLARLVIVVDEYATMLDEHPDLHFLFVDLAARGRSLGMHLVLCTQRPGAVVRDGILANAGLRICLRVNNSADSVAVVGSDAAAALPAAPKGRAVVRADGGSAELMQVARTTTADVAAVIARWATHPRPNAPWRPPLPGLLTPADLGVGDVRADLPFALADFPEEQRQDVARFDPARHGNLLVVGGTRSGKSTLLGALATAPTVLSVERVDSTLAAVWDAAHRALATDSPRRVLLLDDVDAIMLGCPDDYLAALLDLLTRLLREGPGHGIVTVLTAQRLPGSLHALAALCGSPLLLGTPSRQEHLLAGGDSNDWQADLPPGAATWGGNRLQVVQPPTPEQPGGSTRGATTVEVPGDVPLVVVSTRPREMAARLRSVRPGHHVVELGRAALDPNADSAAVLLSRGGTPAIVVGDPDAWLSRWPVLGSLRETADLLFDGCSVGEFRTLTAIRDIPPPPDRGVRPLWLLRRDGTVHRALLKG